MVDRDRNSASKRGTNRLRAVNARLGAVFRRGFLTAAVPPRHAHFLTQRSIFSKASKNASENASQEKREKKMPTCERKINAFVAELFFKIY
jgi:hypothetical protein